MEPTNDVEAVTNALDHRLLEPGYPGDSSKKERKFIMNELAKNGWLRRRWGIEKGAPISEEYVRKVALYGRQFIEGDKE